MGFSAVVVVVVYLGEHLKRKAALKVKALHTIFPGNLFLNLPSLISSNFTGKSCASRMNNQKLQMGYGVR